MSKAEEFANRRFTYPDSLGGLKSKSRDMMEALLRHACITGYKQAEEDLKETMEHDALKCYEQGYKQAEKDLALTTSDIILIHSILTGLLNEPNQLILSEDFCKEVLRLFNEKRNE